MEVTIDRDENEWKKEIKYALSQHFVPYGGDDLDVPEDRRARIFSEYYPKSYSIDDDGNIIENIPYVDMSNLKGNTEDEVLFDLGYKFGVKEEIGAFYQFLGLLPFAKGYWYGKFCEAVLEDNDSKIMEVSREIRVFDSEKAEQYLGEIVDTCFSDYQPETKLENNYSKR